MLIPHCWRFNSLCVMLHKSVSYLPRICLKFLEVESRTFFSLASFIFMIVSIGAFIDFDGSTKKLTRCSLTHMWMLWANLYLGCNGILQSQWKSELPAWGLACRLSLYMHATWFSLYDACRKQILRSPGRRNPDDPCKFRVLMQEKEKITK